MRRFALAAVLVFVPVLASAQQRMPVGVEATAAFAIPTGDWAEDDNIENGVGYGVAITFSPIPVLGLYGGFDRTTFGAEGDGAALDTDIVDAGYRAGVELRLPLGESPAAAPFIRAGGVYNTTTFRLGDEDGAGSLEFESDAEPGLEVAVGVAAAAGPFVLRPALFFRTHSAEFDLGDLGSTDTTVRYFGATLAVGFGG